MPNTIPSVAPPRERAYAKWVRPGMLFVFSALLTCTLLPLGLAVALMNAVVLRDPRKVLFVQERCGLHGRPFRMLKFRTMRDLDSGLTASPGSAADIARVTRFGRFLRNTHLDELPQLINVLRGQMALIGPRPEMVSMEIWAQARVPGFGARLVIPPGLTGYAQITQGYAPQEVDAYQRKLDLNLDYLERISLRTDVWILWRTLFWVLRGRGWACVPAVIQPRVPSAVPLSTVSPTTTKAPPSRARIPDARVPAHIPD